MAKDQSGWTLATAIVVLASTWAGCSKPSPDEPTKASTTTATTVVVEAAGSGPTTPESEAPDSPKLEVLDEEGFARMLTEHRGEVVLVDFWATWCLSCIELFPHTAALQEKYADRGLRVVTIALNDPEDEMAAVCGIIEKKGGVPTNYICRHGASEKAFDIFAIDDGTLPHLKLYDRQGRLHRTFASGVGGIEPEQIDQAIDELLAR